MKPISIRLDDLTQEALVFLRGQPGGYNLNQAVKRIILDSAIGRGWSPGSVVQDRPTKSKVVPAAKVTKVVQEHTGGLDDFVTDLAAADTTPVVPEQLETKAEQSAAAVPVKESTPQPAAVDVSVTAQKKPLAAPTSAPQFSATDLKARLQLAREKELAVPAGMRIDW